MHTYLEDLDSRARLLSQLGTVPHCRDECHPAVPCHATHGGGNHVSISICGGVTVVMLPKHDATMPHLCAVCAVCAVRARACAGYARRVVVVHE
jgi:hypothetical protein